MNTQMFSLVRETMACFGALALAASMSACSAGSATNDGALGSSQQALCPANQDCEPADPTVAPPPQLVDNCGGNTYNIPPTNPAWKYPQDATLIRYVNRFSSRVGYAAGFPDFNAAKYTGPMVFGTHLLPGSTIAAWQDVPRATLGNVSLSSIPDMMRAAHDYAMANGYVGALPTFEQGTVGGQVVYGISLLSPQAVEFRDVYACELGDASASDASQMFRAAHAYAVRNGLPAAFPTFHSADYGNGTVFGLVVFKPGAAGWRDVPYPELYTTCGGIAQIACDYTFDPGKWCDVGGWYNYNIDACTNRVINCGSTGQVCCNRTDCGGGLECAHATTSQSFCRVPPCGGEGQACCGGGSCNSGLLCDGSTCSTPAPTSGSVYVGMSSVSNAQWFRFENLTQGSPVLSKEVKIASVENTSGYTISLSHIDKDGYGGTILLSNGAVAISPFAGKSVSGSWGATLHNVTMADAPFSLAVKVNWVQ